MLIIIMPASEFDPWYKPYYIFLSKTKRVKNRILERFISRELVNPFKPRTDNRMCTVNAILLDGGLEIASNTIDFRIWIIK